MNQSDSSAEQATEGGGGVHEMDVDHSSSSALGPFIVGIALVGVGIMLFFQTLQIPGEGFDPQGPRFLPMVMVVLWLAFSVVYLVQHSMGVVRNGSGQDAERFGHVRGLVAVVALLVIYAFVLDPLGYIISTSLLFIGCARALSSRNLRRDVVVGIALSLVVYLSFTRLLNVSLPEGILGF